MRIALLGLLLISACNSELDAVPPFEVSTAGLEQRHVDYLLRAMDRWNVAVGQELFVATGRRKADIRVVATPRCVVLPGKSASAFWDNADPGDCDICLADAYNPLLETSMFMHELGHCLALNHDDIDNSVMNGNGATSPEPDILEEYVLYARELFTR